MAQTVENTPQQLVMQFGSTKLTLDKTSATASLQRKMLFWTLQPVTKPLADISDVKVDTVVDRASGVEVWSVALVMASGAAWTLTENDQASAQATVSTVRNFLGSNLK
jgi:hypothetical protein